MFFSGSLQVLFRLFFMFSPSYFQVFFRFLLGSLQVLSRFSPGSLQVLFLLKFQEALTGQIILRLNYINLRTYQTFLKEIFFDLII